MRDFRQREVETPHFALPFKFGGISGGAIINEQDSTDDVLDCVKVILAYPIGSREDLPKFGVPDILFKQITTSAITGRLLASIVAWDPRAELLINERPDIFDALVRQLRIRVKTRSE